jgi:hypothetical protein
MDGFAVGLGLLIAGAVIAFLAWPWQARRGLKTAPTQDVPAETLDEQYDAVLSALRDLDFDHAVGKVAEEDYATLRRALLVEAANLIAQLDERTAAEANLEARLEKESLALRQVRRIAPDQDAFAPSFIGEGACTVCGRMPRLGDLYCADCGARLSLSCPDCGRTVDAIDCFCAGCGTELVPLWKESHELG